MINGCRLVCLWLAGLTAVPGQVTYERLLKAEEEPGNWLTYSGGYRSHRYSRLDEVTRENVKNLEMKWVFQMRSLEKAEVTPLVVDGVMYLTQPPNDVVALDTRTGQPFWIYKREQPEVGKTCCGRVNRGLAILGDRLYMGTVDARLVALDARTGYLVWEVGVSDPGGGYAITAAPLALKDLVIVGVGGGEFGIRGFLDAYDAQSGKRLWRFYTVPEPGEPGNETWPGDTWKTGGAPTWVTGSFDPDLNLLYWGTGNPSPNWNADVRKGDNLYSDSVIALDPDTGKLKWYFQFTPNDPYDWDSCQIPLLVDMDFGARHRKLMLWANRNAFYYVLDRETGEFLTARPFAKQTWAQRIDENGRPVFAPASRPNPEGTLVYPGLNGGTNWYSPSYSPKTRLVYVAAWDYANVFQPFTGNIPYTPGELFIGGVARIPPGEPGWGAVRALVAQTGKLKWEFKQHSKPRAGVLSTAGDLVFSGDNEGYFFALDAHTGELLWRRNIGGSVVAGPISYLSGGNQYISIAAGNAVFTFGLRE